MEPLYLQHFWELIRHGALTESTWAAIEAQGGPQILANFSHSLLGQRYPAQSVGSTQRAYVAQFGRYFVMPSSRPEVDKYDPEISTALVLALLEEPSMLGWFLRQHSIEAYGLTVILAKVLDEGRFGCMSQLLEALARHGKTYVKPGYEMALAAAAKHDRMDIFSQLLPQVKSQKAAAELSPWPVYFNLYLEKSLQRSPKALFKVLNYLTYAVINFPPASVETMIGYLEFLSAYELRQLVKSGIDLRLLSKLLQHLRGKIDSLEFMVILSNAISLDKEKLRLLLAYALPYLALPQSDFLKRNFIATGLQLRLDTLLDYVLPFCEGMLFTELLSSENGWPGLARLAAVDLTSRQRLHSVLDGVLVPLLTGDKMRLGDTLRLYTASQQELLSLDGWINKLALPRPRNLPTSKNMVDAVAAAVRAGGRPELIEVAIGLRAPSEEDLDILDDSSLLLEMVWRELGPALGTLLAYSDRPSAPAVKIARLAMLYGKAELCLQIVGSTSGLSQYQINSLATLAGQLQRPDIQQRLEELS